VDREILSDSAGRIGSRVSLVWRSALWLPRARDAAFYLLLLAWPWIGLFGREPWKSDEAYTFGLIWSLVQGKGWLVPLLAGEPFMEKPPLFYRVSALCTEWFGGILSPHEAARIAIPLFLCVALGFLAAAARALLGTNRGFL
jgi:4-amino-4-deoxy-L-arabinose transferase-like glycosyltransferase